jgi:hypothetical protein
MNRRSFLHTAGLSGAGLVATATLAEAGALAEFFDWLRRRPSFSFPSDTRSPQVVPVRHPLLEIGDWIKIPTRGPTVYRVSSLTHRSNWRNDDEEEIGMQVFASNANERIELWLPSYYSDPRRSRPPAA